LQQVGRQIRLRRMVAQSSKQMKEMRRSKLMRVNSMAGINQIRRDQLGKGGVAKY
jgi:hypothetical protein